ncbi:MAG: helix-turn-helix domain-containing protein [Desulfobacterales bacterium]|jgi:REP element-mobilizing transposase RayT
MPRKARIDAPGALQHVICRGIENRNIFFDTTDKNRFVERLGTVLLETQTPCYSWALLDNHLHLLLKTGNIPISKLMLRILTGYAVSFNRRHKRAGHLFQNRFKSILCQEDTYLLELVRYIHLNPLRAGLVNSMPRLDQHRYCGHSFLMGLNHNDWQDVDYILKFFGKKAANARQHYREFVAKGIKAGKRPDLMGGGLIRTAGGWAALRAYRNQKEHTKGDERILGESDFVETVIREQNERMERRYRLQLQGYDFDKIAARVAQVFDLKPQAVLTKGKKRIRVKARGVLCFWAVNELGMTGAEVARRLKISKSGVSRAVARGEEIAAKMRLNLFED